MYVVALDIDNDVLYFVPENNANTSERLVLILDIIKTEKLTFWYSNVINDDDANIQKMVDIMEEFLSIVYRLLLEERKKNKKET